MDNQIKILYLNRLHFRLNNFKCFTITIDLIMLKLIYQFLIIND
jgi:hypothetical protein